MKANIDLRMATGDGANSYATNSRIQEKAILETRPVLHKAVQELCMSLAPGSTMVVADLGCSSGPNTLLFMSEVMSATRTSAGDKALEVQFFLNDLPGNDFNLIFRSLERLQSLGMAEEKAVAVTLPHYVAGLPGSFYTRLFPSQTVHFFHSCYSLMWRSQVHEDLSNGTHPNEGNIYIGKTTSRAVVKLFKEQFETDFELFLKLRYTELVYDGCMVLTLLSDKNEEILMHGDAGRMWELLAEALQNLVQKGMIEMEKFSSFNLPFYAPSVDEVKALINKTEMFRIQHIKLFESSWDPNDDLDDDEAVLDCARSAQSIAKSIRAVIEPLIIDHLGDSILDYVFSEYASIVAKHLKKGKARYRVMVISLKKVIH